MKQLYFFIHLLCLALFCGAQDTFSIVAVDSATGEVGSAGASCLEAPNPPQGCLIISDVIPGKAAMHTQALWNQFNQENLRGYVEQGFMPAKILYEVNQHDDAFDSTIRQYGIALFDSTGRPRTGAFTGSNCYDYKNHIVGPYYTVQGNIILCQYVLDSIEARFLRATGSLADRLMAALQGANIPGADSRCMNEGVPSKSAFIRVAKPTDKPDSLYLHLVVKSRPYGVSPIDSLQTLFDAWKAKQPSAFEELSDEAIRIYPNPASNVINLQFSSNKPHKVDVFDMLGKNVYSTTCYTYGSLRVSGWQKGAYFIYTGGKTHRVIIE